MLQVTWLLYLQTWLSTIKLGTTLEEAGRQSVTQSVSYCVCVWVSVRESAWMLGMWVWVSWAMCVRIGFVQPHKAVLSEPTFSASDPYLPNLLLFCLSPFVFFTWYFDNLCIDCLLISFNIYVACIHRMDLRQFSLNPCFSTK